MQFDYAFKGDVKQLRAFLKKNPASVEAQSVDRQMTLLYTAARFGQMEIVKMLVEDFSANLANVNKSNKSSPLHGAAFGAHSAIVRYLLEREAPFEQNDFKESPLDNAKEPAEGSDTAQAAECVKLLTMCTLTPAALLKETKVQNITSVPAKASKSKLIALLLAPPAPAPPAPVDVPSAKKAKSEEPKAVEAPSAPPPPVTEDAPSAKKAKAEKPKAVEAPAPPAPPAPAPAPKGKKGKAATADAPTACTFDAEYIELIRNATFTMKEVPKDTEAFWELEEKVQSCCQGRNDDYVKDRLKKKKKPITFILKSAEKVNNPTLEKLFADTKERILKERGEAAGRVRIAFHGSNPKNIPSIIKTSLLRFQHPLNPCKEQADDGYFGTNKKGVYVSRYYDYTLKYANAQTPLDVGQTAKVIMFKALPGNTFRVEKLNMGMEPTPGHDSHSSPSFLEWYMFNEHQLCPEYVLEIQAKEDTRTAADDE